MTVSTEVVPLVHINPSKLVGHYLQCANMQHACYRLNCYYPD